MVRGSLPSEVVSMNSVGFAVLSWGSRRFWNTSCGEPTLETMRAKSSSQLGLKPEMEFEALGPDMDVLASTARVQ